MILTVDTATGVEDSYSLKQSTLTDRKRNFLSSAMLVFNENYVNHQVAYVRCSSGDGRVCVEVYIYI